MKKTLKISTIFGTASGLAMGLTSIQAATILYYDSQSGGAVDALDLLPSQTDSSLVASASAFTTLGARGAFVGTHATQANVQGLGDENDLLFRFGNSNTTAGDGILSGTLSPGHAGLGPYIGLSYTAAQNMILDGLSFNLWNNSNNANSYGARDVGLFVNVAGAGFTQFGALDTSATNNGNQGTIVFSDSFAVNSGDLVEFRLAFTDRTRTNNDLQAATRIGAIDVSGIAVPEPTSIAVLGLGGLSLIMRRRRV